MRLYQFFEVHKESFNAGSKAVEDVFEIARRMGAKSWPIIRLHDKDLPLPRCINRLIGWVVWKIQELWLKVVFPSEVVLLIQHPLMTGRALMCSKEGLQLIRWLRKNRKLRVITLIHDISELRSGGRVITADMPDSLSNVLSYSDVLIVHNEVMLDWLKKHGASNKKLVVLEIFDYLTTSTYSDIDISKKNSITFAGNLRPDKCGFLKRTDEVPDVEWYLYGAKFDPSVMNGKAIHYCGCVKPDELPCHLKCGFGLVWDGDDLEGCSGEWGGYLKWNNPHKLSLYLASGLPVVTWQKAAVSGFIHRNDVGFTVENLKDLSKIMRNISNDRYREMCGNARKISGLLRDGHYIRSAIEKALVLIT